MPAMYAHDTFGRKVAAKLPLSVKRPILQYPQMFRVGLQGPDVLFFYNPFTEHPIATVGGSLHKKPRGRGFSFFLSIAEAPRPFPSVFPESRFYCPPLCPVNPVTTITSRHVERAAAGLTTA